MHTIICLEWEESERGWGTRPDGVSLHLTEGDRDAFVKAYWVAEGKRNPRGVVPDEYSRPAGSQRLQVGEELYQQVSAMAPGLRLYGAEAQKLLGSA